jgi:hypothetical protein
MELVKEEVKGGRRSCMTRNFIIYTLRQLLLWRLKNENEMDDAHIMHEEG